MSTQPKRIRGAGGRFVPKDGGAKALGFAGATWDFVLPGTKFNYAKEVGDGLKSSVIVAALSWVMRAFPEAPPVVERKDTDVWKAVEDHKLVSLLRRPNPYYGGHVLWMATVMDFVFGEAFWLKVRNGAGDVVELWWIPRALIRPMSDPDRPDVFISHYEYRVGGEKPQELKTDDVVHFRFGMNPDNPRRGFSQLAATFREVYTDDQASNFTASILRNLGIIGLVFSPDGVSIPPAKVEEFKKYVQQNFTGDKRGQAMIFSAPTKAEVLSYNLQGFDVGPIRDISEERVCAALGIPAAVIGFGTGLQQTKVGATMKEMIQLAWRGSIMPTQEIIADELDRSLLPEFQSTLNVFRVKFDTSKVRALWEDVADKHDRIRKDAEARLITIAEARRELGYEVKPEHEVWLQSTTVVVVDKEGKVVGPMSTRDTATPTPTPTGSETPTGENDNAAS